MEKYRKKDLLALIATLADANDSVIRALPADGHILTDVFVQCQEAAIQIGTYLESLGDQYQSLVEILEDYCETIYQMSIATADSPTCRRMAKKIRKQLMELQSQVRQNLPEDRREVVFLPYKASMWDSLESVWKAADADENTDAYVIPIPYFDKNPDGSFREEHYEGDLYPDYVPITHYNAYDFQGRRPDVIYIHNPYDDANYVTSVHPFFYSQNLKKFTEKLVYIPYFILGEVKPDDQEAIDRMKHFCIAPGVFHADQVIVQSEDMRQVYIKVLTEETAKNESKERQREIREYWEKKIDGSGSPKIDKVMNTKVEELEIPGSWRRIIYKSDGTAKKVVLYNNGINALLRHNEAMIIKMQSVFQIFKMYQNEIALLWRPHPLIESTLTSMRPELWMEYEKLRDQYLMEGWGIYDDTPEIDRAIVLSDAYYGDGSSLVQLYQKTGKWVMIQNPNQ